MTRVDYSSMTHEEFTEILEDLVHENSGTLLLIPGVYEVLSEHFNNEILERWARKHGLDEGEDDDD